VVVPLFLFALLLIAALVARMTARLTGKWLQGTSASRRSDDSVPNLALPVAAAVLTGGLLLVLPELPLPARLAKWTVSILSITLVLSCAVVLARIAVAGVSEYAARNPSVSPALGVARVTVRVVFGVLALLMALQTLGVPVTPLLTTLGIGSLAVALALQDTLANFFAGLYLLADRPVRAGDYIKIQDNTGGQEGYVDAIGWRSSRLRTLRNNIVIVPNQKLSQAVLTNYHLPLPQMAMGVPIAVSYDADPEAVEAALLDELQHAAGEIPEIAEGRPSVSLTQLGDSAMVFDCGVTVRNFESQGRAAHQLRKRLLARLRQEGIEIPYPQRVIHQAAPRERRREVRSGEGDSARAGNDDDNLGGETPPRR
jgi:small-conductance mechanosensitive channel